MTTIRDLLKDLLSDYTELTEELELGEMSPKDFNTSKDLLIDNYIETIKERIVG